MAPSSAPEHVVATSAATHKRQHCAACLRPQSACICPWITPLALQVEVLILQHPLEVDNTKGTARLLQLSLPNSQLLTGEVFDPQLLADSPKHQLLLYPEIANEQALGLPTPPMLDPACLSDPAKLRLIVLDGTWRKSRKILYLNPLLQQLPRLSLRDMPASSYRIRRAHAPDQLSTLEATCAALAQLEGDAEKFQPLLAAFDGFVAQQLSYRCGPDLQGK